MSATVLQATRLNKWFYQPARFQVLHNVSLSILQGEFVSIMGKSGCGKSTLLYLLSTLDTEYEGRIDINGITVTGLEENALARFRNQHIGFVFQFHFLLPEFTALENVMLPALKLAKLDREAILRNAMERLREMDLHKQADRISGRLSGGEQQRIAIARALINSPNIIMADEPTGNLDSTNTSIIFSIFNRLASEGNTIVTVTHDHDFANRSHRIIEMVDGRVSADG